MQCLDHIRATTGKQLLAHLDPAASRVEPVSQAKGGIKGRLIQGDDQRRITRHDEGSSRQLGRLQGVYQPFD
ncbi:hypothetical protein Q427_15750 [Halomonas sp. BC04]|nr:hypothetical protein Q427_15750 [Halomonas sp. BC04]